MGKTEIEPSEVVELGYGEVIGIDESREVGGALAIPVEVGNLGASVQDFGEGCKVGLGNPGPKFRGSYIQPPDKGANGLRQPRLHLLDAGGNEGIRKDDTINTRPPRSAHFSTDEQNVCPFVGEEGEGVDSVIRRGHGRLELFHDVRKELWCVKNFVARCRVGGHCRVESRG